MKRALLAFVAVTVLTGAASAAERFTVEDKGGFGATGRFIEFASRYGWQSYEIKYDFGLDLRTRELTRDSTLWLTITKRDGGTWSYRCRANKASDMWANINKLYGKGVSVLTECRISPKKFAKAVDLEADLVGEPTLVFHVMVQDGEARAGVQKGFYFLTGGQIEAGAMSQYATERDDPSELGVLFASAQTPHTSHPYFGIATRYVP